MRALARERGLGVADKPDSVEICFVPDGDHADLIAPTAGRRSRHGRRDRRRRRARCSATHDGYRALHGRPAQGPGRRGGQPRYVLEIVPETRTVVLGDPEDLLADGLAASRINWLIDAPGESTCSAKIRYRHAPVPATVTPTADGGAIVEFAEPQSAVTPGQAVVFYDGDRVLGGGWIEWRET